MRRLKAALLVLSRKPAEFLRRRPGHAVFAWGFFAAALALYAFRLGVPAAECYDEVHHVKTARQFVELREPTEWTHPHLGKLAMALSIRVLGDKPFAWRLPQALAGGGTVALVYLLGAFLFRSRAAGFLAALLLLCDGLQFGLSRIGMLDAHATFFIVLSMLIFCEHFFVEWKPSDPAFLGLGAALGLALSSKWTALYTYGCVLFLMGAAVYRERRKVRPAPFLIRAFNFLVLLPAAIYLLSFFRYVQLGHSLREVLYCQIRMWNYHARIADTHHYASQWWSWPLLLRPVWTYFANRGAQVEGMVFLGNPAVFWMGIPCLAYLAWRGLRLKERASLFVLAAFCFQYLPWAIQPRKLTFFHHFYSALPFMCLAIAHALNRLREHRRWRWLVLAYMGLVIGLFAYFYPLLSAWPISWPSYMDRMWFRSWI